MTRILVAWEDRYFTTLGPFVNRRVSARAPFGRTDYPKLLHHTAHGNGGFIPYVQSTWARIRTVGLPADPGSIDHLLCVADGDRIHECLPSIPKPPPSADEMPAWLADAEAKWQAHLRNQLSAGGAPPGTVHGRILRWCKESVLLAGYDIAAVAALLGVDPSAPAVQTFLAGCRPSPSTIVGAAFTDSFRRPLRCLEELSSASGSSRIAKNAPEIDDALRALARDSANVAARVPDLDHLADLSWELSTLPAGEPNTPPAPQPGEASAPKAKSTRPRKSVTKGK
jgi:hypothetical protein